MIFISDRFNQTKRQLSLPEKLLLDTVRIDDNEETVLDTVRIDENKETVLDTVRIVFYLDGKQVPYSTFRELRIDDEIIRRVLPKSKDAIRI